jgi:hypothetical protein
VSDSLAEAKRSNLNLPADQPAGFFAFVEKGTCRDLETTMIQDWKPMCNLVSRHSTGWIRLLQILRASFVSQRLTREPGEKH